MLPIDFVEEPFFSPVVAASELPRKSRKRTNRSSSIKGEELGVDMLSSLGCMISFHIVHFNFSARSSAFKCVYLFNICKVLWPVMAETSIGFSPFSKNRLVASCRRS
jgi:hypothetical protein